MTKCGALFFFCCEYHTFAFQRGKLSYLSILFTLLYPKHLLFLVMADFPQAAECESRYSNIDEKCYATAGSRVRADNFRYMTSEGKQRRRLKRRKKSNFGNCRRSKRRRLRITAIRKMKS